MSAHARRALERVGERFREAETAGKILGSQLIESIIPQRLGIISRPPGRFSDKRHSTLACSPYREFETLHDSDGSPLFTSEALADGLGTPRTNSAGEPFDCEPGATRSHYTFCESGVTDHFDRIAAEAGRVLHGLPGHLQALFPFETLIVGGEVLRWVFAVYDLAWDRFPGTPLPNPVKKVWARSTSLELDSLPRFRRQFPEMEALKFIPDPPDHWFAEIDDLFSVSRAAVDVLLATWDSVPQGSVGVVAPQNLDQMREYLADELRLISKRSAASPQFRDATEETRFEEVYPRRYWGPYRRFAATQVRDAERAINNAKCWLDHHNVTVNRPEPLWEGSCPGDAERCLSEWLQAVTLAGALQPRPKNGSTADSANAHADSARSMESKKSEEGDGEGARLVSAAGHVKFLEFVRDEVRYAADCKRQQVAMEYPNSTLKNMVGGIKWTEARERIAMLSVLPAEIVKQVEGVLRRELTVGTVEQIDELLTPAVRALRDVLETARSGPVSRPRRPAQALVNLLGRVIRRLKTNSDLLRGYVWDHPDSLNVSQVNEAAHNIGLGPIFVVGEAKPWWNWPNLPQEDPKNLHRVESLTVFRPDGSPIEVLRNAGELNVSGDWLLLETIACLEEWLEEVAAAEQLRSEPTNSAPVTTRSNSSTKRGTNGADDPLSQLLSVFTNGLADDRIQQASSVLCDEKLTTNEKLTEIDRLIRFPATASAEQLAKMFGVSKTAVIKTEWWTQNRRGGKANEIGRRRSVHNQRAAELERTEPSDEDE